MHKRDGEDFQVRFNHKFESSDETFFAFAIPFSYLDCQVMGCPDPQLQWLATAWHTVAHISLPSRHALPGKTSYLCSQLLLYLTTVLIMLPPLRRTSWRCWTSCMVRLFSTPVHFSVPAQP